MSANRQDVLAAIAYIASAISPSWERPGIEAVLARIEPSIPLEQVAHAAITAAAHRRDQRSPMVIAQAGSHWQCVHHETPRPSVPTYVSPPPRTPEQAEAARAAAAAGRRRLIEAGVIR